MNSPRQELSILVATLSSVISKKEPLWKKKKNISHLARQNVSAIQEEQPAKVPLPVEKKAPLIQKPLEQPNKKIEQPIEKKEEKTPIKNEPLATKTIQTTNIFAYFTDELYAKIPKTLSYTENYDLTNTVQRMQKKQLLSKALLKKADFPHKPLYPLMFFSFFKAKSIEEQFIQSVLTASIQYIGTVGYIQLQSKEETLEAICACLDSKAPLFVFGSNPQEIDGWIKGTEDILPIKRKQSQNIHNSIEIIGLINNNPVYSIILKKELLEDKTFKSLLWKLIKSIKAI